MRKLLLPATTKMGLFLSVLLAGCGNSPTAVLKAAVAEASESFVCQTPATRESRCTVTMRARVAIEEVGGRDVYLDSVAGTVWDTRGRDNLQAVPALLTSDEIRRIAGSTVIQAHGKLTIEYELHYLVGQAPFYINGPPLLVVLVRGRDAAGNIVETSSPGLGPGP